MIDIVKAVEAADPSLGTRFIVLRPDSRALAAPDRLAAEAESWIGAHAPDARLLRKTVLLSPYPGGTPTEREVTVLAFTEPQNLAAFATAWTGDPEVGGE